MRSCITHTLLPFMLLFGLVACGGGGGGGDEAPAPPHPSNPSCIAPDFPAPPTGEIALEAAFPGLPLIPRLVGLYQPPGDNSRWYALSQQGSVVEFDNLPTADTVRVFLDIEANTFSERNEAGMLGLAFHPNYPQNPNVYIYYMPSINSARLSVFNLDSGGNRLDPASERVLLEVAQPASNHNGGGLIFGPDGYLYLALGDGGGAGDGFNNGQDTETLLGTLLRLDINVSSADRPYGIPADNPFADGVGGRPEIYAYGLRNPWRWSFDRLNGDIWLGDVGQYEIEEIDKIIAGGNYGWPIMEGASCYDSNQCDRNGLELPVVDYTHGDTGGCSVTGGYVYRGNNPALAGTYIFGDFCNGVIYGINSQSPEPIRELADSALSLSAFAEDQSGELYALDLSGTAGAGIFRLTSINPDDSDSLIPQTLSASGCFSDTANLQVAPGVVPYEVNAPFWSDGADKERYFAIPDGTSISFNALGELDFPQRSVLIKHFYYQDIILETRLMMRHLNGWAGYSYQWNDERTDATLLEGSQSLPVDNSYSHYFPSRGDCMECHTAAAGWSLGLETLQLNDGSQLQSLQNQAYLDSTLPPALLDQRLFSLQDDEASVEDKARSYLHSNCSYCHRPGGPISGMDLRYSTPLAQTGICNVSPTYGDLGVAGAQILAPGEADRSVLSLRVQAVDNNRMPPLASDIVDSEGAAILEDWINSLSACP